MAATFGIISRKEFIFLSTDVAIYSFASTFHRLLYRLFFSTEPFKKWKTIFTPRLDFSVDIYPETLQCQVTANFKLPLISSYSRNNQQMWVFLIKPNFIHILWNLEGSLLFFFLFWILVEGQQVRPM